MYMLRPDTAGELSDKAILDTATHSHDRQCLHNTPVALCECNSPTIERA